MGDRYLINAFVYEDNLGERLIDGSQVHCLALTYHYYSVTSESSVERRVDLQGILLRPVPNESGVYTRICYLELADEEAMKQFGVYVNPETKSVTQDESVSLSRIRIL
jgi:hypothetical protein